MKSKQTNVSLLFRLLEGGDADVEKSNVRRRKRKRGADVDDFLWAAGSNAHRPTNLPFGKSDDDGRHRSIDRIRQRISRPLRIERRNSR